MRGYGTGDTVSMVGCIGFDLGILQVFPNLKESMNLRNVVQHRPCKLLLWRAQVMPTQHRDGRISHG